MSTSGVSERRWPQFDGWDEKATAIEALARACGAHVYCAQKYQYLEVEIQTPARTPELTKALFEIADMIEELTDRE